MQQEQTASRIAQAASTFGAAILGAGAGSGFGSKLKAYSLWIIIIGAIIHIYGMYLVQMKKADKTSRVAKFLLLTAWICLIALISLIIYMSVKT